MCPWGDLHIKIRLGLFHKIYMMTPTSTKDFLEWPTPSVSNQKLIQPTRSAHKSAREPCGSKAKQEVRVNPCLLSGNKSRPHLSTYVDIIQGRKGAVLVHERSWIKFDQQLLNMKLSLQHGELTASSFLINVGVLPLDYLEIGWIRQGCRYQVRKSAPFRIAGKLRCKAADNGFKQVQFAT